MHIYRKIKNGKKKKENEEKNQFKDLQGHFKSLYTAH